MNDESSSLPAGADLAGKYLTFLLKGTRYGVEILTVQEIIGLLPITQVPQSPNFIKGVINLRGRVIPVIDLRLKLDIEEKEYDDKTCIIVVNLETDHGLILVGVVVDEVSEVTDFSKKSIQPPPQFGVDTDTSAILGIGNINDEIVMLLNIQKALSEADSELLKSLQKDSPVA